MKTEKVQPEQTSSQVQVRPCPQDCGKCSPWQQMFCCTKMTFELSKTLQVTRSEIAQLREEIVELKKDIPRQVTELIDPSFEDTAQ